MNKITLNKIYLSSILFVFLGCSKSIVKIEKANTDKSIIIKMNSDLKKITGIKLPFILTINNISNSKKEFIKIKYLYGFKEKGAGIELFDKKIKISNNKKKVVLAKDKLIYSVYSRHFTDSTKLTQQKFKHYINKMLELKQDTLHIGKVTEFKQNHTELFKKLTENDSISIQFLDGKKLGKRITIPTQW